MWNKPTHLSAVGTARPLRVAYLIDPADCPDALLDAIFADAYSRWGGRRTLIVPASVDGIDTRYSKWLWHYDADVIYSFVDLSDAAVARIHERYGPAHLVRHDAHRREKGEWGYYRIELPLQGLSSLSVVPAFLSRSWGFLDRVTNLRILDKYPDRSESQFLKENFGFLSESFASGMMSRTFSDLFTRLTLISQKVLEDRHMGKDPKSQYEVDEGKILEALGQRAALVTLAQLSEFFAPYLDTGRDGGGDGLSLVAGDSVDDRLLFWNGHHRYEEVSFSEITSLRIPAGRLIDTPFLMQVNKIIKQRGKRDHQGRNDGITLRSCSVGQTQLEEAAEILRKQGSWLTVRVARHDTHAACVPTLRERDRVRTTYGLSLRGINVRETTEFKDNRVNMPAATPWHIREALPPAGLRSGNWMVDLVVDRLADHCRYSNVRHTWVLPRRVRLERAFTLERPEDGPLDFGVHFVRIGRDGLMAVAHRVGQKASVITIPEDLDAFRAGLCNDYEWAPFNQSRDDAPHGLPRYGYAEPSDKGRYLLAVLGRFDTVPGAFKVLMDGYWRDVLLRLGAVPVEKNLSLREELIRTLQKRLKTTTGKLVIRSDEQWQRLAREALRFGRKVQREERFVRYEGLKASWLPLVEKVLDEAKHLKDSDKEYYERESHLDRSIQHLCQREILFQGREWRCRICFNRNWITIDRISQTLTCEVCGREEPAPVSGDWHFQANPFVVEAYREHGVEAVIWALWQLSERAQRSFYFAPSMWLWDEYPKTEGATPDAELDALVVVDGELYLCEAKSSAALDADDVDQIVRIASRIRPDVLLIACMDELTGKIKATIETLKGKLGEDIRVELMGFNPESLRQDSLLPC